MSTFQTSGSQGLSGEFRLRVCFAEEGRGAYLGHLEVVRAIERIVRRASLPYAVSQGFHPHMRLAFCSALPVGVASEHEYFDVILTSFVEPQEALSRLRAFAPPALPVVEVGYVSKAEPSLTAAVTTFLYRARLKACVIPIRKIEDAFSDLRTQEELEVEQKGKIKVFDPSHCIPNDAVVTQEEDGMSLTFSLRVAPNGALRPDVLLQTLLTRLESPEQSFDLVRIDQFIPDDKGGLIRPL